MKQLPVTWCDVVCQDSWSTKRGAAASSVGPEETTLGLGLETGGGRMVCVEGGTNPKQREELWKTLLGCDILTHCLLCLQRNDIGGPLLGGRLHWILVAAAGSLLHCAVLL